MGSSVEIYGFVHDRPGFTEGLKRVNAEWKPETASAFAQAHEQAGFDGVLVPQGSGFPDSFVMAEKILFSLDKLRVLVAHRPALESAATVGRRFLTLLYLIEDRSRLGIHVITGSNEQDLRREGDFLEKSERYDRTAEFLEVFERVLYEPEPFDFEGTYYRHEAVKNNIPPVPKDSFEISFAGQSEGALRVGALYGDTLASIIGPRQATKEKFERLRTLYKKNSQGPRFSLSLRPIVSDTVDEAWELAHYYHSTLLERITTPLDSVTEESAGLKQLAFDRDLWDDNLWLGITKIPGAGEDTVALVGDVDGVARGLASYAELGADRLIIRGFDPLHEVQRWGHELIDRTRYYVAAAANI
ncbi:MAG: LLM class flavin-dependent oxidoreductase [Gordonia sp. (in: high G+C Gram-positive bacteria)]